MLVFLPAPGPLWPRRFDPAWFREKPQTLTRFFRSATLFFKKSFARRFFRFPGYLHRCLEQCRFPYFESRRHQKEQLPAPLVPQILRNSFVFFATPEIRESPPPYTFQLIGQSKVLRKLFTILLRASNGVVSGRPLDSQRERQPGMYSLFEYKNCNRISQITRFEMGIKE